MRGFVVIVVAIVYIAIVYGFLRYTEKDPGYIAAPDTSLTQ